MQWIVDNKELIVAGVAILGAMVALFKIVFKRATNSPVTKMENTVENHLTVNVGKEHAPNIKKSGGDIQYLREKTHIMFVDDQSFKACNILKKTWVHTSRKNDISDLNSTEVRAVHIFFLDIHGVGKKLGFSDEGLGLAGALMDKYPDKKFVIYSAKTEGDRFNPIIKRANESLKKNADPYTFEQVTERLAKEYWQNR
jgi:hypothetical protein